MLIFTILQKILPTQWLNGRAFASHAGDHAEDRGPIPSGTDETVSHTKRQLNIIIYRLEID